MLLRPSRFLRERSGSSVCTTAKREQTDLLAGISIIASWTANDGSELVPSSVDSEAALVASYQSRSFSNSTPATNSSRSIESGNFEAQVAENDTFTAQRHRASRIYRDIEMTCPALNPTGETSAPGQRHANVSFRRPLHPSPTGVGLDESIRTSNPPYPNYAPPCSTRPAREQTTASRPRGLSAEVSKQPCPPLRPRGTLVPLVLDGPVRAAGRGWRGCYRFCNRGGGGGARDAGTKACCRHGPGSDR